MAPMSLAESGDSKAAVSLAGLFDGVFKPVSCEKDTVRLVELACRGGWPEAIESSAEDAQLVARACLELIYSETVPDQGMDLFVAERLVGSIARNLGQSATYATIAQDIYGAEESPQALIGDARLAEYLRLLRRLYLLEKVPGWARPVPLRYYRDGSGLEADVIIELSDGRWAAVEIKLGEDKVEKAIESLNHLEEKVCSRARARVRPPEFKLVLVGVSEYARKVGDRSYVVPLRLLGA